MDKKTAFVILGIDAGASFEEAKTAFRSLAKQHHPDLVRDLPPGEMDSGSRMKEINLAFCYLTPLLKLKKITPEPEQKKQDKKSIKKNGFFSIISRFSRWASRLFDQKKVSRPAKNNRVQKEPSPGASKRNPVRFEQVFKTVHPAQSRTGQKIKYAHKKQYVQHGNPYQGYQTYLALKRKIQMSRVSRNRDMTIGRIEKIEAVRPVRPIRGK